MEKARILIVEDEAIIATWN